MTAYSIFKRHSVGPTNSVFIDIRENRIGGADSLLAHSLRQPYCPTSNIVSSMLYIS